MEIVINGVKPMGAVRMTRRGKWTNPAAQRYLSYKQTIGNQLKKQFIDELISGPIEVDLIFKMPIPESWSNKKKREAIGQPHVKKSDIDNLIKGVFDASNKIIWNDDNQVYKVAATKIYSTAPGIEIIINRMGEMYE